MGLDWNPGNRPRPGFEGEFRRLADGIRDQRIKEGSPEHDRFFEISISAYETLQAPRVGSDPRADEWIRRKYHEQPQQMSEAERELHRRDIADLYVNTARRYEHSAIFFHPPGGNIPP